MKREIQLSKLYASCHNCSDAGAVKLIFLFFKFLFLTIRRMIICGAIFGLVSLNLNFKSKAVRDWNSVNFISRQFLGTSYHSFDRVLKKDLKRVSDWFCQVLSSRTKEKLRATNILTCCLTKWHGLATKLVSTCHSTSFLSESSSYKHYNRASDWVWKKSWNCAWFWRQIVQG